MIVFIDISDFYDDTNFYSIDESLKVTEKYSKKKNLKRRKFLRNNFPLTNFYMFVLKKYKFKSEEDKKLSSIKLSRKMPNGWVWGDDPLARYEAAGIKISREKLLLEGSICR